MADLLAVSRVSRLPLVGSDLALDFTNTSSGRGTPFYQEHLRVAEDVVGWACHARILTSGDSKGLELAARDSGLAAQLVKLVLELREVVYVIGTSIAKRHQPAAQQVNRLTRIYAECVARARLMPHNRGFVWAWDPAEAPVESILGPIALSALTLLTQADLSRIKQCSGDHCGWLFLDTTKNKSRRWCEMEVCGNRAKQKRHQLRQKIMSDH